MYLVVSEFKSIIISIFLFLMHFCVTGQETLSNDKNRFALSYSGADQTWLQVDYQYESDIVSVLFLKSFKTGSAGELAWTLKGTFGATDFTIDNTLMRYNSGYEAGLSLGIRFNTPIIRDALDGYLHLHSGPHYLSDAPERQVPGLLISSGVELGLSLKIMRRLYIEPFIGFRHMSNGEVKLPNGGLNNVLKGITVALVL